MASDTNLTIASGLSPEMQTYYDRQLLESMKPKLVHYEYAQKRPYKRQNGKMVSFRKWTPFSAATAALTEGVIPDGQALESTEIAATVAGYGGYVAVSELLDLTAIDPVICDAIDLMADQGALSVDTLIRDTLHRAGTSVIYAGGAPNRDGITFGLIVTDVRKAARLLKKNKALPFVRGGKSYYVAIVGPDTTYDLQSDELWQDVAKYQDAEAIFSGEIGRLFGVIFVESSDTFVVDKQTGIVGSLVLGQNAYGVVDIEGSSRPRAVVKTPCDSGTSDPLEQISTVGWKVDAFAVKVLQQGFMVRIEHKLNGGGFVGYGETLENGLDTVRQAFRQSRKMDIRIPALDGADRLGNVIEGGVNGYMFALKRGDDIRDVPEPILEVLKNAGVGFMELSNWKQP